MVKASPKVKKELLSVIKNQFNSLQHDFPVREDISLDDISAMPNTRVDRGTYVVRGNIYLSIWSFKNKRGLDYNDNESNYQDAINLSREGLGSPSIKVDTHSDTYPVVKGYLITKLTKFFNR